MLESLLIYQKSYALILFLYPIINRIPKNHRLVLGRHLEELSLSLLVLVIKANKARNKERRVLQEQISERLDCLRILIRLTKDLRLMSVRQYAQSVEKTNEIGRMLAGWVKV